METALVIVIGDAAAFDSVRCDFARATFEQGIPFHVTLLYPFAPPGELSEELLADLRSFFAATAAFEFDLARIAGWPDVVYAVPEPDADLRRCMQAIQAFSAVAAVRRRARRRHPARHTRRRSRRSRGVPRDRAASRTAPSTTVPGTRRGPFGGVRAEPLARAR